MTEAQGAAVLDALNAIQTRMDAVGTVLTHVAFWIEVCAWLLVALLFFSASRRGG